MEGMPLLQSNLIHVVLTCLLLGTRLGRTWGQPTAQDNFCSRFYAVRNNSIIHGSGSTKHAADASAAYAFYFPLFRTYANMVVLSQKEGKEIGEMINRPAPTIYTVTPRPSMTSIYSFAFVDTAGPNAALFKMNIPAVPANESFFSASILDGYTEQALPSLDNQELDLDGVRSLFVYGDGYSGPEVPKDVISYKCKTQYCWILNRFGISANTTEQINQVQQWQTQLIMEAYPGGIKEHLKPVTIPMLLELRDANSNIEAFFNLMNKLSVDSPPGDLMDESLQSSFENIGVGPGETFKLSSFSMATQEEIQLIPDCFNVVMSQASIGDPAGPGWTYSPQTGVYSNYLERAYIALTGLGATVPSEITYASTGPKKGPYRMNFEVKDYPDAVQWSVTAYNQSGYIVPNPYNIYEVNAKSPNLNTTEDGRLSILFRETEPEFQEGVNWLPTPGDGSFFNLLFRMTLPGEKVLDHTYKLPAIIPDTF
ncbi:hypothetical protein M9435_003178 [Picochlorum sp. BPE23]|nr:hypothetical protein M9435_003178 [Picochlorum sp. BPE23]